MRLNFNTISFYTSQTGRQIHSDLARLYPKKGTDGETTVEYGLMLDIFWALLSDQDDPNGEPIDGPTKRWVGRHLQLGRVMTYMMRKLNVLGGGKDFGEDDPELAPFVATADKVASKAIDM